MWCLIGCASLASRWNSPAGSESQSMSLFFLFVSQSVPTERQQWSALEAGPIQMRAFPLRHCFCMPLPPTIKRSELKSLEFWRGLITHLIPSSNVGHTDASPGHDTTPSPHVIFCTRPVVSALCTRGSNENRGRPD